MNISIIKVAARKLFKIEVLKVKEIKGLEIEK